MAKKKTDPRTALEVSVMPELAPTELEGLTIRQFLESLKPFFQKALQLELSAKATLQTAREMALPKDGEEDAAIQTFIRTASADRRNILEHWKITSLVHQFQRRLVAARERGAGALEEASTIAQRLHNTYVDQERRRVEAENERKRIAAEAAERKRRDDEAAELERQALEAEAQSSTLSPREEKFVELILAGVVASQAALRAGYKDTTRGVKMLEQPKIAAALDSKKAAIVLREQADARKAAPIVADFVETKADVQKAGVDRTTYSAELLNERLLIEAILGGQHGIPSDVLTVNPVKLNEYARSLREVINRWPGVKLKTKTTTV